MMRQKYANLEPGVVVGEPGSSLEIGVLQHTVTCYKINRLISNQLQTDKKNKELIYSSLPLIFTLLAASIPHFLTAALNLHVFLPTKFVSFVFNNSL